MNVHELSGNGLQEDFVDLSVVIPAFNEEYSISEVVRQSVQRLQQECGVNRYELLVVDDGSTDQTGHFCDELDRQYPTIHVFHHAERQGLGSAWKTGFMNARGRLVSHIPGDGQITIEQAIKLYHEIGEADLIVSGRQNYASERVHRKKFSTFHRRYLSLAVRYLMMWIVGFDLTGKEGIFVIRRQNLQQLHLTSSTGLLQEEIFMQCYRNNDLSIKESTIMIQPRISGESKVTNVPTYIKTFWEMFKLRIKRRRTA